MSDCHPAKSLADLAAEQGIGPVLDPDEFSAKEPMSDGEYERWQAAMDDNEAPTIAALTGIIEGMVRVLGTIGSAVAADIRVPKDLRDEVTEHVAGILAELPQNLAKAAAAK